MFRWYEQAQVCYAYLSDVASATEDPYKEQSQFLLSEWFMRGWTLQELLAPYCVDFFDRSWNWIGSRASLGDLIRIKTGIADFSTYKTASVAQKMSWASRRETRRIEDRAYCLLGLFGVHMPPLYGEGENAFIRLQLEIISKTNDDSIFAWDVSVGGLHGLLATSPRDFASSSSVVQAVWDPSRPAHSMSSKGLCVHFKLVSETDISGRTLLDHQFLAPLNCALTTPDGKFDRNRVISLCMNRYGDDVNPSWHRSSRVSYFNVDSDSIAETERTVLYVPQTAGGEQRLSVDIPEFMSIRVAIDSLPVNGLVPKKYLVKDSTAFWRGQDDVRPLTLNYHNFGNLSEAESLAAIVLETISLERVGLVFGISKCRPWLDIVVLKNNESIEQILDSVPVARKLLIGHDRVSRHFLKGSLNGRLKMGRHLVLPRYEVTFDPEGRLLWPVRENSERKLPMPYHLVSENAAVIP